MNNYQDILESFETIYNLSVHYIGRQVAYNYKEIELIYTDGGYPYIEMYPNDVIQITKKLFVNTRELPEDLNDSNFTINDENGEVGIKYDQINNYLTALKPGKYVIKSSMFGGADYSQYNITNISDPDMIIVVKEIPILQEVFWSCANPLTINVKDKESQFTYDVEIKGKFSDGSISALTSEYIKNNFTFESDNYTLGYPILSDGLTLQLYKYNDQMKIEMKYKNSDVKVPTKLHVICYDDVEKIDNIKQSVYYIYYISENPREDIYVTDKPIYIEKNETKTVYVKVLSGVYDHGRFTTLSNKLIDPTKKYQNVNLISDSDAIQIVKEGKVFKLTGLEELDNVPITIVSENKQYLLGFQDTDVDVVSIIDTIVDLKWQINNTLITEINNGILVSHLDKVKLDVTDIHNILLNEIICTTQSGKTIHIEEDCVFSSTEKSSTSVNDNVKINGNKIEVIKSHECKIIFNGSTKYNIPNIIEVANTVEANIVMTKEDVFAEKIEIYETGDSEMKLLNDETIDTKMLETKNIYAVVYPTNATYKEVKWFSDDESVATIDDKGKINIVNAGSANITCRIKYPTPEDEEFPEYVDGYKYDPDTGSVRPIGFNPPDLVATILINATKIDVTEISFDKSSTTLYVGGDHEPYYIRVNPTGASIKDVKVRLESDDKRNDFLHLDDNDELYVSAAGTGTIIAYSIDNPEITAEMKVIGVDTRVKKVIISTAANDNDYEYYDSLNERHIYNIEGNYVKVGDRTTEEKYDDDDFNRYYLPVNNSMQLDATFEPSDAIDTKLKWLSSDSNLVKINDKGIMTAIRPGKQELDVYGDDNVSESRFANTVWVTALNTRFNKYGICQVRVGRNKTLAIDISVPAEHDYDIDDILEDGTYDRNSEHEYDYVMHVGDTIKVPISLSVQDSSFGTSDMLKWMVGDGGNNVLELTGGSPDHSNAYDEEFDWTGLSPSTINNNKNQFDLTVKAVGIGNAYFYAKTYDNVRGFGKKQIYVPAEAYVTEIGGQPGLTGLNMSYGAIALNVHYYNNKLLTEKLISLRDKIKKAIPNITIMGEGTATVTVNGYPLVIMKNGVNVLDKSLNEAINIDYFMNGHGVAITGTQVILSPNGLLKLMIPNSIEVKDLKTNGADSMPLSFTVDPVIPQSGSTSIDENGNEILDVTSVTSHIEVSVYGIDDKLTSMPVYIDAPYKSGDEIKRQGFVGYYTPYRDPQQPNIDTYTVKAYFPSSKKSEELTEDYGDEFNARPGTGVWVDGPKSRTVTVRVVATPSKLKIGWINAYNPELVNINVIKDDTISRTGWNSNKYHYMAIGTDDDFKELIADAETWGGTLDEKYKSYAWFSDNEEVIRFEDVEDLAYVDENGDYTNNPNESIKESVIDTKSVSFKNINASNFNPYIRVHNIGEIKFGENYKYTDDEKLYTNNTDLCILRLTASRDGKFYINHSGSLQYANNEAFENSKTVTVNSGYKDSEIPCNKGDIIYIKGATSTIVYIKAFGIFDERSIDTCVVKYIENKSPSDYSEYTNDIYIKLPGENTNSYITSSGIILKDDSTAIKFSSKYDSKIKITFSGGSIKIKSKEGTKTVGNTLSPYTLETTKGVDYVISGSGNTTTIVSSFDYTYILDAGEPGGYKGTTHYKLKSSFMKRVICEGKGKANIYVLSPKGQAIIKKQFIIK